MFNHLSHSDKEHQLFNSMFGLFIDSEREGLANKVTLANTHAHSRQTTEALCAEVATH